MHDGIKAVKRQETNDQSKVAGIVDLLTWPAAFTSIFKEIKQQLQHKCIDYAKSVQTTENIKINILNYAMEKCQGAHAGR